MQRRIAAIHDISCFGRCSLTVVLPIVSSCGVNCAVIPTSLLSTHTGGFKDPLKKDLTPDMLSIAQHWNRENLTFDAIYTGYLGSTSQPELLPKIFKLLSNQNTKIFIDPVLGDGGKLYGSVPEDMIDGMRQLAKHADLLIPNITEACLLTGVAFEEPPYSYEYIDRLLKGLSSLCSSQIVLKGVSFDDRSIGCVFSENGEIYSHFTPLIKTAGRHCHGSGDIFASVLVGRLVGGYSLKEAVVSAADFIKEVIKNSISQECDAREGLNFETSLWKLTENIGRNSRG